MTGYQSDQFFNIGKSRPDQWSRNRSPSTFVDNNSLNDDFLFPDKTVRNIKPSPDGKTWTEDNRILQKGYIRRINEFNEGDEGPVLCRFQFNPQYINQAAMFQSGIVNPIYQPVEQLQQPIPSMTNFSFRLIFDRSMEVNSSNSTLRTSATDNPWEAGDPSQVGVLHDINALFRVIGQGISASDVEGAIGRAKETLAAGDNKLGKDEITEEEEALYTGAVANATRFFQNNVNVGNTSFILPYPVRIVFSSLYIVEGFVTNTSLEILKFSSTYVPMQAQVTMSVSAIYIGFAKRNTYFTHALEESAVTRRNELARVSTTQNEAVTAIRRNFNTLYMSILQRTDGPSDNSRPVDRPSSGTTDAVMTFNRLFDDFPQPGSKRYSNPRLWAGITNWRLPPAVSANINPDQRAADQEASDARSPLADVKRLLDNGELTEVTLSFKATIFGPFNSDVKVSGSNNSAIVTASDFRNHPVIKASAANESPLKSITMTTYQQLRDLADPATSSSFININLPTRFSSGLGEFNTWLLLYEATYKIVINGVVFTSDAFSTRFLGRNSTSSLLSTLVFSWDQYFNSNYPASASTGSAPTPGQVAAVNAGFSESYIGVF
jgi:hypothetical protein